MRNFYLCLALAAAVLGACGDKDVDYDASGVFEVTEVIVSAQGTGEILALGVEEGQTVGQGERLGLIDTLQLSLRKRQLMASLSATDSRKLSESRQIASLRQQIENLSSERKRFASLFNDKAATQKQVDDIDHQIRVLQRQLAATQEQIGSSNSSLTGQSGSIVAQIAQIDDQIWRSVVSSPISGTVLTKYMERGEYAAVGKPLFKVGDVDNMKLRAYITAGQLTSLRLGQQVTVYADQGEKGRKAYKGRVEWISDKAEFTPKTIQTRDERANLVYAVKIGVDNDGLIKAGMYGDVKF